MLACARNHGAKGQVPPFARQNANIYYIARFFGWQMVFPVLQAMEERTPQHKNFDNMALSRDKENVVATENISAAPVDPRV